ncbi:unnamed protein product [Rotaria socialis]|uniref:Poly [ADP-ribose] polymerase n=2 Tax=Rotaria socialis TaxID=392032 RepID=A0A820A6I1_9BILA|nr:unnamed protein product [Rotaria socialis]CAF4183646.1 unnamed protein product [Rotaria socialis]
MVNRKTPFKAATARRSRKVEEPRVEEEESNEDMMDLSDRHSAAKDEAMTTVNNKRNKIQSKNASTDTRSGNRTVKTGLDGKYWNDAESNRRTSPIVINYRQFNGGNASSSSSSVDSSSDETTGTLSKSSSPLSSSSSSSSSSDDDNNNVLYKKNTFVTCRNVSDSFYLCLILQDVYMNTKKIRISWCSIVGEKGDDTPIGTNTRFILDYTDTLDPSTILLSVPDILYHYDNTMSLKNEDITETKRLLEKSIRDESLSSDDMMETEHHQPKKTQSHLHFESTSDSSSSDSESPIAISSQNKKRKRPSNKEKVRKQPGKKRARKTSKNTAGQRRSRVSGVTSTSRRVKPKQTKSARKKTDNNDETVKPKKKTTKIPKVPKTQLFKVHSNGSLKENTVVTNYQKEPFFEDNLPVPFISSFVQSKLAIRAVLINDAKLLKSLINDVDHVCSIHVNRSLYNDLSAMHYAIKNNNVTMVKILLDDIKTPKKKRCPFPTVSVTRQTTGRANIHTFGFRTATLMASRGAKEGNNALNKDNMSTSQFVNGTEIISYALKNNCSRQIYELLCKHFGNISHSIYDNIHKIIQAGHHKLAASIIDEIKDNMFHGFNYLHHQVLLYDNEDIKINRAASAIKKTRANFMITPIHCAAINPNAKYLKQLLNIMPEYNILDKYERRPIHFAAACEGPEPLEFLLSKQVNFNDVDRGGNSPLHIAAINGRAINAELLLRTAKEKAAANDAEDQIIDEKFGLASINRMNKSRFYPLHLAVLNNHLNCLKVLLEYGADADACTSTSSGKLTPLMLACQKGYLNIVSNLIDHGAKIEARDRFKRTPLIHACMCGNANVVSYLLRLGANANVFDSSLNTALHYAVAYGWYFCVRLLLEAGADLNCVNSWQTTCLAIGFLKGHYGLCDYLLTDHGVDINFKNEDGLTLVMLTVGLEVSSSAVEQLEYVVTKHNADCTIVDANGSNALHYFAANTTGQNTQYMDDDAKRVLHNNYCKMAEILLANKCDPNKMNNKAQTPLMVALQTKNFIFVDYLINKAKIDITSDISNDGKTLLHYFAKQCHKHELIQTLMKLPINDEIKKMGQIFDNDGRTPFHYCSSKFNEFCQRYKSSKGTDQLKQSYESIVKMIKYCLESAECDPDIEIKTADDVKKSTKDGNDEDDDVADDENDDDDDDDDEEEEEEEEAEDETSSENNEQTDDITPMDNETLDLKLKETSIFFLLRTVPFIDSTIKHPLEFFLKKTKNLNVLHYKTHRTPLLEAIHLQQHRTAQMLINHASCDINLSTSNLLNEYHKTPLILACKLQLLPVIHSLLEYEQCDIVLCDNNNNQGIHYYLQTSNRTREYLDILNLFIKKLKVTSNNSLNIPGQHQRTPLHIAVYHNLGTIDAITDVEKVLIENGSDLLLKDNLGNIPLHNVFVNKKVGDDPVELCVLIMKAMRYKSMDTLNNHGDTPLHLAVEKCSTVCVMLLQQNHASLSIENSLSNSIIGTCIASNHLNLFITFLQQTLDIDLGKLHQLPIENSSPKTTIETQKKVTKKENSSKIDKGEIWKWKFSEIKNSKEFNQYSLIHLIIERDWQGALSLILNETDRFYLTYLQIIEAAIMNNKLNLVHRLLLRLKDEININETNSREQNIFHLIANMNEYNETLLKPILLFIYDYEFNWNTLDKHGSYPIHYACVKQNFIFIDFIREKYPKMFDLNQLDAFGNTAYSLLFWSLPAKESFLNDKLRLLITSGKQLDRLCNYDNELIVDPLSFGYINSSNEDKFYPPNKSIKIRTSPLIHAVVHNNFELVKFLLELKADINFPDENKQTPLMHAVVQNNIEIVKLLLNKNYSPDDNPTSIAPTCKRLRGRRPKGGPRKFFLGVTTTNSNANATLNNNKTKKFQKTSSINLNAIDIDGRTCIHHLVQPFADGSYKNNIDILRLLHSCGASLAIADSSGLKPLDYAIRINCEHLHTELKKLTNERANFSKTTKQKFDVNDPNKKFLDKTDFYNDAQNFIDQYITNHPANKSNIEYKVDKLSGMSLTGEVLIDDDKNEPYDVRLTKTDVSYGTHGLYNFYRMQIIKHKSKNNLYFLFTRWGRMGNDEGQHQLTPFSTFDECRKEFVKVFREKTGNLWKDTDQFEAKPKKYSLVRMNEHDMKKYSNVPIDFNRLQTEQARASSQLQSSAYKNLMQTLINRQAIRNKIHKTKLDIEWMPVSQLKRETLEKARDLLMKIKETIQKKNEFNAENRIKKTADQKNEIKSILDSIYQYTNEYYTLIPFNGYADEKLAVLDNENLLKDQEKILDDLFELELSYKILLGAQANIKSISPLDYLYKSMNCQFQALTKDDIDSQLILRYVSTSSPDVQIEQIFKVARFNEDERLTKCNINNHCLLWHGTGICNLISILSRGLLVGSLAARATGSLFGTGIYTADSFAKSLGYCSGVKQNDDERCFMLLCEVALGNIKEVGVIRTDDDDGDDDDNDDKPLDLKRFQSRKGAGRRIPDPKHTITRNSGVQIPLGQLIDNKDFGGSYYGLNYNEYIVYDEAQVALRYLIQFRR